MQKKPIRILIWVLSLFLLGAGIYYLASIKNLPATETNRFTIDSLLTPTGLPLPTTSYSRESPLRAILEQLFRTDKTVPSYSQILASNHKLFSSAHFELYTQNNFLPVDGSGWLQESEKVYAYERSRTHLTLEDKTILLFLPRGTDNCSARGTTLNGERQIILIYANQDTSQKQMLATLAHELGHVFINKNFQNLGNTVALNEGMATWIAGDYWSDWQGYSFNDNVRMFLKDGTYLPLYQNFDLSKAYSDSDDCLDNRDKLLTELASFIDYLMRTYGLKNFTLLINTPRSEIVNSQRVVYPPDFYKAYGLQLNQLENEWLIDLSK